MSVLWQVTSLTGGYVHSRLVDFGNTVECKATELCTAAFVDFPSQSFYCRLHGAEDIPPATVVGLLRDYESKKPLVLAVCRKTAATYFVDLVDSGDRILILIEKLICIYILFICKSIQFVENVIS